MKYNTIMGRKLGNFERQLLAYAQLRNLREIRTGDLREPLNISGKQERELLSRMSRSGMIAQVRRGLYLVPSRLPLGSSWTPDEILVINTIMDDADGKYQLCGPNAFNRYGFIDQIPVRSYAYNNRISGKRKVGAVALSLIKVNDDRLGGTEEVTTNSGLTAVYSSRTRTLVDGVYDWSRFNSLPKAFYWIETELAAERVEPGELVRLTLKFGNLSTIRRVGALLERLSVSEILLRKLEVALRPSSSLIPWIPTKPKKGKGDTKWGVVWNDHE
jgi:predicted transcriptional regulator of viral defense system